MITMKNILVLLGLLTFTGTGSWAFEANPELELDLACDPAVSGSCSSIYASECNSNRKCQCKWQYWPEVSKTGNGKLDFCNVRKCTTDLLCVGLYSNPNATCHNGSCKCQPGFDYDTGSRQCELMPQYASWKKLGEKCATSGDCGGGTMCSQAGYCSCGIGSTSKNNFSCDTPACDSDEYCRGHVTPGSVCLGYPGSVDPKRYCRCQDDHEGNYETMACVPRYRKLGEQCLDGQTGWSCGSGATCLTGSGCVCRAGYTPKTGSVRECEQIQCLTNTECLAEDMNSMCLYGRCTCREDFRIDTGSQKCHAEPQEPYVLIVFGIVLVLALASVVVVFAVRKCQATKMMDRVTGQVKNLFQNPQNPQNPQNSKSANLSSFLPPPPYSHPPSLSTPN